MKTKLFFFVTAFTITIIGSWQKANAQSWLLAGNNNANDSSKLGTLKSFPLKIYTHNIERMRVDINGNVGIGSTSPWNGGTVAKIVQLSATNFPQYLLQATNATTDNKVWRMIARNSNIFQIQTLNDAFSNEQTGLQINRNANLITTVSFPNGSVGIGTTNPWSTAGASAKILQVSATQFPQYLLQANNATANNKVWRMIARSTNDFEIQTLSDAFGTEQTALQINRNANSIANVSFPNGNVGIGANSPGNKLTVANNVTQNPTAWISNTFGSTSFDDGLYITAGNNAGTGGSFYVAFQRPDGSIIGTISQNSASSVSYNTTSDERLKTNIHETKFSIADLNKIQVKDYDFINGEKDQTGFIAQQLYKIFPVAVSVGGDDPKVRPWMVDYGRITPLLVKAVQELSSQNDSLKQSNQALSDKLNALSDKVTQIENAMSQCCSSFSSNIQSVINNAVQSKPINAARLDQNVPNPFNNSSSISYYIPSNFHAAQLMITDVSGKVLKTYSIASSGFGKQIISGTELTSGVYQYSLLIDGKVVDTKKMIVSK